MLRYALVISLKPQATLTCFWPRDKNENDVKEKEKKDSHIRIWFSRRVGLKRSKM